jgi:hypothetical protein
MTEALFVHEGDSFIPRDLTRGGWADHTDEEGALGRINQAQLIEPRG